MGSLITSALKNLVFVLIVLFATVYVKYCQAQNTVTPIFHDSVTIDVQPTSYAHLNYVRIDKKSGPIPVLNFHYSLKKPLDNSYKVSITVYMKLTDSQREYTRLIQLRGQACDLCTKSRTMKSFARFGNLTSECPIKPGEYVVSGHSFSAGDLPPSPGRRLKVVFKIQRTETDYLQFTYTGVVNPNFRGSLIKSVLSADGKGI